MIGNEIHVPDPPGLVTVNVPPARSSGRQLPVSSSRCDVVDGAGQGAEPEPVGGAHHGNDEALEVEVDRDTEVDVSVHDERVAITIEARPTLAFMSGYERSASHTARATKGRYVSEKPSAARHASLCSARTVSIAL